MLDTILFDLDGTLAAFMQDDFVRLYFKALVRRLAPMGYDGEKLLAALWRGVDAMVANDGTHTNRQVFWESFVADLGVAALALEGDLNDFYGGPDFDAARACLHEEVDRRPLISALREKGYSLVLATNPIFPAVAVETRLHWIGLTGEDFDYVTTYENSRTANPTRTTSGIFWPTSKSAGGVPDGGQQSGGRYGCAGGGDRGLSCDRLPGKSDRRPIDGYTHGFFRDLEAYLAALPVVERQ